MVPGNQKALTLLEGGQRRHFLDRSVDGGKTWTQATFDDGGTGMRDLAYVSATTGCTSTSATARPSPTASAC